MILRLVLVVALLTGLYFFGASQINAGRQVLRATFHWMYYQT